MCNLLQVQLREAAAGVLSALCTPAQSALRLKPTFTDAYNNLASALVQQGRVPAALQCYQAALTVDPTLVGPQTLAQNPMLEPWCSRAACRPRCSATRACSPRTPR